MKTYTLRMPNGKQYAMTDDIIREMNEMQGRRRLTGGELDGVIMMQAGVNALLAGADSCARYMSERKLNRRVKPCVAQLQNAVQDMLDHVEAKQFISIHNNLAETRLTISSLPVPMCTNVRTEDLSEITKAATANCAATCMKTLAESKYCPLRRALETIPGMKEAARDQAFGLNGCPYMTI